MLDHQTTVHLIYNLSGTLWAWPSSQDVGVHVQVMLLLRGLCLLFRPRFLRHKVAMLLVLMKEAIRMLLHRLVVWIILWWHVSHVGSKNHLINRVEVRSCSSIVGRLMNPWLGYDWSWSHVIKGPI